LLNLLEPSEIRLQGDGALLHSRAQRIVPAHDQHLLLTIAGRIHHPLPLRCTVGGVFARVGCVFLRLQLVALDIDQGVELLQVLQVLRRFYFEYERPSAPYAQNLVLWYWLYRGLPSRSR
jgi:hypothetical protein